MHSLCCNIKLRLIREIGDLAHRCILHNISGQLVLAPASDFLLKRRQQGQCREHCTPDRKALPSRSSSVA